MRIKLIIFIIIFVFVVTVVGSYHAFFYRGKTTVAYFWDSQNNVFQEAPMGSVNIRSESNLGNNSTIEKYKLEKGSLTIEDNSKMVWQSPSDWLIDSFVIADSNNDGTADINLSVWKAGNFGTSKPFWIKENDMSIKNHFFVFDFINGAMNPIWQSSNLETPNCEFAFVDIDGDEKNDLITIEGEYSQKLKCDGRYVAIWKWNGWGFSNEWRSEKGNFSNLKIKEINDVKYIVVDSQIKE